MQFFRKLFDFYLNSSIHVTLAVYALSWITLLEFKIDYDEAILYFIFYATITGYNFVKYFGLAKFHHRRLARWLKVIQIFSLICFILFCYYAFQLKCNTLVFILVLGIITFFYAIPFLPKNLLLDKHHNLRSISGIKIYIIALVWTGVTVLLPLINNEVIIDNDVVVTAIQRFIFVMVIMLPFEIRDLQYDSLKLSTFPQRIGVKRTKIAGVLLLIAFFFMELLKDRITSAQVVLTLAISTITLLFLIFANEKRNQYYSSFWVESLPIIWLVILLLFC